MIQIILFFLFTLSVNSFFPIFTERENEPRAFITLHQEMIIQDSGDLFIQQITDATITSSGYILFTSGSENRVYVFDEHGTYLQSFGNEGRGPAEFGQQEEIDIYTLEGEIKTMITLPPGEDEYRMLGIYGDEVLFRVTDADETPSLHIYRIEYGE